jgi:hypothetical protein
MKSSKMKNKRSHILLSATSSLILLLTACGGGGGGAGSSGSAVTNNGAISNPTAYTLPTGISTVPPTGNQAN